MRSDRILDDEGCHAVDNGAPDDALPTALVSSPVAKHIADLSRLSLSLRLGSFQCDLLYWGEVMPGAWRNYLHTHSFIEVCYAFAGRGTFHIHGREYVVQEGDEFVARPDEVHQIVSSDDGALGIYFWAYTLEHVSEGCPSLDSTDGLLEAFLASRIAICRASPAIPLVLDLLAGESARREAAQAEATQGLAVKLLIDSCRGVIDMPVASEPISTGGRSAADLVVQKITRYLRDNYGRAINIRDVAAQVHLSERHTSRLFHQVTGTSPMEYLTSLRLHVAEQLLLSGSLSIQDVANQCGYPDVQYFSTLFHRHAGLPPGRFRDQGGTRFLESPPQGDNSD